MPSRLQSFETEVLTQEENVAGLAALNRELVAWAEAIDSPRGITLDMDSTEVPTTILVFEKAILGWPLGNWPAVLLVVVGVQFVSLG